MPVAPFYDRLQGTVSYLNEQRILRFAATGLVATMFYAIAAGVLSLSLSPVRASVLAYAAAAVLSYLGHKYCSFRSNGAHGIEAPRFLALTLTGLLFSYVMPNLLTDILNFPFAFAILATCVAIPIANYFVLGRWVFSAKQPAEAENLGARSLAGLRYDPVLATCAAVLALSLIDNLFYSYTHPDISWLLVVSEKVVRGQALYADILETNPPFSMFLYFPTVLLEHFTRIKAEFWVGCMAYLWLGICVWLSLEVSRRCRLYPGRACLWLVPVALALLLLALPATFAEREFFAVAAAVPMVLLVTARLEARADRAPLVLKAAIGVAAAMTMLVKPHYAAAFVLPYCYVALRRRSVAPLFSPEIIWAAVPLLSYAAITLAVYPEYASKILPVTLDVYISRRVGLPILLQGVGLVGPIMAIAYIYLAAVDRNRREHVPMALAFAGLFLAYLVQGKGWSYHALPFFVTGGLAVAMAAEAAWPSLVARRGSRRTSVMILAILGFVLVKIAFFSVDGRRPDLAAVSTIRGSGPISSIDVIASDITVGHPLARILDARWVGLGCSDWYGSYALEHLVLEGGQMSRKEKETFEGYIERAVAAKARELTQGMPDLIVIDEREPAWLARLMRDPRISEALTHYVPILRSQELRYMRRSDSGSRALSGM